MAIFLNNNVGFQIAPVSTAGVIGTYVDLSNHVKSITINKTVDELESTAMGNTGHYFIAGLESSTIAVDFFNDTATSSVLQTLNSLVGLPGAFKICQVVTPGSPTTATPSATNPLYSGQVLVNKLTPVNGAVADIGIQSLTFTVNGVVTVNPAGTW
jgi:hypothetical protein